MPCSGTIKASSLSCEVDGTTVSVTIRVNDADTSCDLSGTGDIYTTCTVAFSAGDRLQPYTNSVTGTFTDCTTAWWVRYD